MDAEATWLRSGQIGVPAAADLISSAELIERYRDLCQAADRHADEGWRSLREDGEKRQVDISVEQLDRFADYIVGGIGFEVFTDYLGNRGADPSTITAIPEWTQEQAQRYGDLAKSFLDNTLKTIREDPTCKIEEWARVVRVDGVVGGRHLTIVVDNLRIDASAHTIRVSPRAFELRRLFGHVPGTVLEIGGGHGRFVRDVLMLAPRTRIIYVDLVFNLLVAARYLTRLFGDAVHLAWDDAKPIPREAQIVLVPPWRMADIPARPDVCCNFLSFQHMQADNLRYYGETLNSLDVGAIYHLNRLRAYHKGEVDLVPSVFGDGWFTQYQRTRGLRPAMMTIGQQVVYSPMAVQVLVHDSHSGRFGGVGKDRSALEGLSIGKARDDGRQGASRSK